MNDEYVAKQIGDIYLRIRDLQGEADLLFDKYEALNKAYQLLKKKGNTRTKIAVMTFGALGFGLYILDQRIDSLTLKVDKITKGA